MATPITFKRYIGQVSYVQGQRGFGGIKVIKSSGGLDDQYNGTTMFVHFSNINSARDAKERGDVGGPRPCLVEGEYVEFCVGYTTRPDKFDNTKQVRKPQATHVSGIEWGLLMYEVEANRRLRRQTAAAAYKEKGKGKEKDVEDEEKEDVEDAV